MQSFETEGTSIFYAHIAQDSSQNKPLVIWAHGWGQNHAAFIPIINSFLNDAEHISLDLPGFGQSPPPPDHWGTAEYGHAITQWLKSFSGRKIFWVGHSFGCRVGIRIAAQSPKIISHMILIAGAGLKKKRPLHQKLYFKCRIKLFKMLKKFVPDGAFKDKLMAKFGSADYKNSGVMKNIFIRTVNEDLSETAKQIKCFVSLIYGSNDTETPAEFGERYSKLIPNNKLYVLEGQDHYSLLSTGRHQVVKIIADIFNKEKKS